MTDPGCNMSFGRGYNEFAYDSNEQLAINEAYNIGVESIAAAGNDNTKIAYNGDTGIPGRFYPCGDMNVLCVGAAQDGSGTKSSFSNYGPAVDYAVTGVGIWMASNAGDSSYIVLGSSGTSMSAPQLAGVVALFKDAGCSNSALENALFSTAKNITPWTAFGYVNAGAAAYYYANFNCT